jgi:hypothetical protein
VILRSDGSARYKVASPASGRYVYSPGTTEIPEASGARTLGVSFKILAEVAFSKGEPAPNAPADRMTRSAQYSRPDASMPPGARAASKSTRSTSTPLFDQEILAGAMPSSSS